MKDALGNTIEIGKSYGFIQSANGITDITIGTVKKFNDNSVTIQPDSKKRAVYHDEPKPEKGPFRAVAVKPFILFPTKL